MILTYIISIFLAVYQIQELNPGSFLGLGLDCIIVNLAISCLCIVISYLIDLNKRREFIFLQMAEIEVEKGSNILSYLLPSFVKKRVKDGIRYIAEDKGTVSVIFCDICDFDKIIAEYSPQELICFLDDVFGRFDKICEVFGVTKIETVGKTYLACAGLLD